MTQGEGHLVRYCLFETAIGACAIAWSDAGLVRLQLPERDRAATRNRIAARVPSPFEAEPDEQATAVIAALRRYFEGKPESLAALRLDLTAISAAYRRIYEATRAVGWGQTATYGEIARRIGEPGAARAVGQAMSRNPVPIVVPCHRILASGGRMGGFSAHGGTLTKQRLLELEGVYPGSGTPLLPGLMDGTGER